MMERVLLPDLSVHVISELNGIHRAATNVKESTRDFRNLAWCSIDNDDSRDLDHLTVAEVMPEGAVEILIAVAKETTS
jgi:exoribonuclease-2